MGRIMLTECVAVDMHNVLGEVTGGFQLGDESVCRSKLPGEIEGLKMAFLGENLLNLDGEGFVSLLLAIEEFRPFRGVIDNLRNLAPNGQIKQMRKLQGNP
jgi:hypothetical protein